jgi:hypothetical protein
MEKMDKMDKYKEEFDKLKNSYGVSDTSAYDNQGNIFNLILTDEIEIIDENHNFIHFLDGFNHGLCDITILHGWYYKSAGVAKFIVKNPYDTSNMIHFAWNKYLKNEEIMVDTHIYSIYYGELYEPNEHDIDKSSLYKNLIKRLLENI